MATQRLITRLREHDWLAAAIELAIVVVGILIALQVSNWNQDRLDSARADRYYVRLHADLTSDIAAIDDARAFWSRVTKFGESAMAFSEHRKRVEDSNWKTLLAFFQASQLYPFELADTTFVEMRTSGALTLVADEGLRKRLADYYRLSGNGVRSDILRQNPVYRMQIRGLTPWTVQQYIWNHCFRQGEGAQQVLLDCPAPISEQESAAILDSYQHDPSLLPNLRTWMSMIQVADIIVTGIRSDTRKLIADVDAARGMRVTAAAMP
ncbi:MAG: hypothetical protein JSR27_00630 [Proteobacteria bacterium]|nr:hypothetical protein [Pseudomonadota bacterium]